MAEGNGIRVAIVDYGLGNLFSVNHACEYAGMQATITSSRQEISAADVVILPGVGAFGDAMASLNRLDLVGPLREIAASGKPLVGICLGLQLLMEESCEFGRHRGLGIVAGMVVRFDRPVGESGSLKVPQVGWNRIYRKGDAETCGEAGGTSVEVWSDSWLAEVHDGEYMYFVHSFYARPEDPSKILAVSRYGNIEFCSALRYGNVFATQFHPERSGPQGLRIYRNIASLLRQRITTQETPDV